MQHAHRPEKNFVPIRWGVVIGVVLAVCVLVSIAAAALYVRVVVAPKEENMSMRQNLDEAQLTDISNRMAHVESVLRIH